MNKFKVTNLRKECLIEFEWRQEEIIFFESQTKKFPRTIDGMAERERYRKSLVMILYSHFEGYCKFIFQIYVNAINLEKIKCRNASFPIVAATLDSEFKDLMNPQKLSKVFKKDLSSLDNKLLSLARRAEFLEEIDEFMDREVIISDQFIDLESNLKPIVMRKNLYKLGLPHDLFDSIESEITQLLTARNGIAHGVFSNGIPLNRYKSIRKACLFAMKELRKKILTSLINDDYRKI